MDWFSIFWLLFVGFAAFWQFQWWREARRTGVATIYFHHKFARADKPFEFKMIQVLRIVGFVVAIAMFAFGIQFWRL